MLLNNIAYTQVEVKWVYYDNTSEKEKQLLQNSTLKDSLDAVLFVNKSIDNIIQNGYLTAGIDKKKIFPNEHICKVYIGKRYDALYINTSLVSNQILSSRYWKGTSTIKKVLTTDLEKAKYQVIEYFENNGYPFTKVWIDSLHFVDGNIHGNLKINLGDAVVLDTLIVKRDQPLGVHKKFFEAYLGLHKGDDFKQKSVDKAEVIIKETPYLKLTDDIDVVFEYGKAMVEIPLEKRKSSRADGIIGLAPNETADGGVLVTGQILLDLRNPFGTGKRFYIDWKKPDSHSQWFSASYEHPRIFRSQFDVFYNLDMQIQDSTFIKVDNEVGVKRKVSVRSEVDLGVKFESSRLLREISESSADTLNDTQTTTYHIGYRWENLDDPLAPRKGFSIKSRISAGYRNVIFNPSFDQSIYEGIPEVSSIIKWHLDASYYFQINRWMDGLLRLNASQMINDHLYQNELYRLGGFRSLRGFNEGEFFVDRYGVLTIEPRIGIGGGSYLFVFSDIAYIGNNNETDLPIGFGAGLSMETKSGIFSLAYALGKTNSMPISTDLAKIHFGFIGVF
ncbi:BamA/TamA family outer membrane protein [Flammeovirga agarivorans]|uniref:BamA/TamA family outer membrane protein n=1 Tax=Flammeovirga agarivorans TaxID=2726742 RepID=A0A7X8SM50_9BACT|nr:BamA/TamA family outer membrane protein [Flammeovirga agarivorans]NLR92760.1 BamA/TamA family outer membrane protein [Flammeovirga agarivorans]